MVLRVKICCIRSVDEARVAVGMGAAALGFVSQMPSGPGVISEGKIAEIVAAVPPPIATFLLTSRTRAADIVAQQKRCRVNTVQLCDTPERDTYAALRDALPGVSLVQVIHVDGDGSIDEACNVAREVDALLLDSGSPSAAVRTLGGTGRTHDWSVSARIVAESPVPVFLAGGLTAENVSEAIRRVRPFGIDLCNGVRTGGTLDEDKLRRFMEAVEESGRVSYAQHRGIRAAQESDFPRIIALYRQLHPDDPVLSDGKDRAVYETILREPSLSLFVLVDQGQIQSTCYLNVIPNITRSANPYAIIENVVTDETSRGRGYGKRIIAHALAAAWTAGCYKVMLQTGSKRESTHAFYRACGFSGDDKHAYVAWRG